MKVGIPTGKQGQGARAVGCVKVERRGLRRCDLTGAPRHHLADAPALRAYALRQGALADLPI